MRPQRHASRKNYISKSGDVRIPEHSNLLFSDVLNDVSLNAVLQDNLGELSVWHL